MGGWFAGGQSLCSLFLLAPLQASVEHTQQENWFEWATNLHLASTNDMPSPVTYMISFSPQTSDENIIIQILQIKQWKFTSG